MNGGTLFQLRNLTNHRNVVRNPDKAVAQCEEFTLVVEAHVVSATLTLLGMTTLDEIPPISEHFPPQCEDWEPRQRKRIFMKVAEQVIQKHVDFSLPSTLTGYGGGSDQNNDSVLLYARET